jgi:magnesium-protoporphyrin IX monomethyl ester (oxidative) cyclase
MKVLLAYPPISLQDQKEPLCFPVGISCLASFISNKDIDVKIFNDLPYDSIIKTIKNYNPNIVGFSCHSANYDSCFKLSNIVKSINKKIIVILGGIHATYFHKKILENVPAIDMVVRSEGEHTFWEILETIKKEKAKKDFCKIKGISYRNENKMVITPDRPYLIENLDLLPPLPYHFFDMKKIETSFNGCWDIHSGRGCMFNCKFCPVPGFWKKYCRIKSAKKIVSEVEACIKRYNVKRFFFNEPIFTINKKRVYEICNYILSKKIRIKWYCFSRIDTIDKNLLLIMKEAGLEKILYGIESFSDRILKLMGKGYKISAALDLLNFTSKAGIESDLSLILGFPGETEDTLRETLQMVKKISRKIVCYKGVKIFELLPYSPIYNMIKKKGLIDDNMWFSGFRIEDFIKIFYPNAFVKKIFETKYEIEKYFNR